MVKRVSKRVSEIVFLIAAGGSTYYLIEIWFRGFSHWTMFVLGGVALTFCSFQGEVDSNYPGSAFPDIPGIHDGDYL